jgi:hypothetical protein
MSDERPPEVLGSLPNTRPHRRSDKRAARVEKGAQAKPADKAKPTPAKAKPTPTKAKPASAKASPARAARKPTTLPSAAAKRKAKPKPLSQPAQPAGAPPKARKSPQGRRSPAAPPSRRPSPPSGGEILSTAVQAAAELTEIGLTASARALRNALSRLPRP